MDPRGKVKEYNKIDKYFDLARELKQLWNMSLMLIPVVVGGLETVPKAWKGTERIGNKRKNRDTLHNNIVEIDQNTEEKKKN